MQQSDNEFEADKGPISALPYPNANSCGERRRCSRNDSRCESLLSEKLSDGATIATGPGA